MKAQEESRIVLGRAQAHLHEEQRLVLETSLVLETAERSFPQFSIFFLTVDLQKSVKYIY